MKSIGEFSLHNNGNNQTVLTVSSKLETSDFPSAVGDDVEVYLVEPDEGEPHLRVYPTED
jgi:hypothetical protein